MNDFSFISPVKIDFGAGKAQTLSAYLPKETQKVMLLHGRSLAKKTIFDTIQAGLCPATIFAYQVDAGEPSPESVDTAAEFAQSSGVDAIVGIGGGSVLDTAKAVAALAVNDGSVMDYLEGMGAGKKLKSQPLFFVAVPTTSGTGTEVTKNAVISSQEQGFKVSMRDDRMIADVAVLDPDLTRNMPKAVLAASGMDAICQLIEAYTTKNTNSITDALALHHTILAFDALEAVFDTDDADARVTLAVSAMVSGLCLANAGLGVAHGLAAGLGAHTPIPHGAACGILLPKAIRFNLQKGVTKYKAIGEALANKKISDADEACQVVINRVEKLNKKLGLPNNLKSFELSKEDIPTIAKASMGSSMKKNPAEVSLQDAIDILKSMV
ncbi:MAG: iron-containing alcohol dehydrogenase [Eubacteriales bacterium]